MTNPPYHAPFSIWLSRTLIWQGNSPTAGAGRWREGEIGTEAAKATLTRGAAGVPCSHPASGTRDSAG